MIIEQSKGPGGSEKLAEDHRTTSISNPTINSIILSLRLKEGFIVYLLT